MSSKPTTEMSAGTRNPAASIACSAPIAVQSFEQTTPVGACPPAGGHSPGLVIRARENQIVGMARRQVLETVHQLGEERVGDVGDDQAEQAAAARHQRAR